jgi:hypothetical protein
MPAGDTIQLTLEAHLERVFAPIKSPDCLKDLSHLHHTDQPNKPLTERKNYAIYNLSLETSQPLMSLQLCVHARSIS